MGDLGINVQPDCTEQRRSIPKTIVNTDETYTRY